MLAPKRKIEDLRKDVESGAEFLIRSAIRELERTPFYQNDPEAFELLGVAYAYLSKFNESAANFLRGYEATGDAFFLCRYGGVLLYMDSKREEGEALLLELIAERKADVEAYAELAERYIAMERPEDAIKVTDAALAVNEFCSSFGPIYALKSIALAIQGDIEQAQDAAMKVGEYLLGREFSAIEQIPTTITESIMRQRLLHSGIAAGYCKMLVYWIGKATPPALDLEEIENQLGELHAYYLDNIKESVDAIENTPEALRITMELFHEMEPSRESSSSRVL